MSDGMCPKCEKPAMSLTLVEDVFMCSHCLKGAPSDSPAMIQYEQITPEVKSSKSHIADIRARRLDTQTGKMYYDKGSRSYFY